MKGVGEAGAVGAPPAVILAISMRLSPLDVTHIDMPATPQRVWDAIRRPGHDRIDRAAPLFRSRADA